jgi:hypothetical protein
LSSKVVDTLIAQRHTQSEDQRLHEGLAYFFCNRNLDNRREPLSILQSIVRQLSTMENGRLRSCSAALYTEKMKRGFASSYLTHEECLSLILELLDGYWCSTIVLDGLDECAEKTRHELLAVIQGILSRSPSHLKVLIASRNDKDLATMFTGPGHLEITSMHNQEDIDMFVSSKMKQSRWCREEMSELVRYKVLRTFQEKSQGM